MNVIKPNPITDRTRGTGIARLALQLAAVLFASAASGMANAGAPLITVSDGWARPTVPGQEVAAVYMNVTSANDATLIKVESEIAVSVQIHNMSMDGSVMKMRELKKLALRAGKTVALAPGGSHLMMTQLKKPLRAGDSVPLTLTVLKADGSKGVIRVTVPVTGTAPQSR